MTQRRYAAGAVVVGAYAMCLVAFAPASLVDLLVQRASEGRARIAEAQGSAWFGTGYLEMRDGTGKPLLEQALSWRFQPVDLVRARLGFDVGFFDATKPFKVSLFPTGVEVRGAEFKVPASALSLAAPALALIGPTGDLTIRIANFSTTPSGARGSGSLEWRSAGSSLTPIAPLGDYEARFEIDQGRTSTFLRTLKGPLTLAGKGPGGAVSPPTFNVMAHVEPQLESQLAPFLRLIGIDQGAGTFELQLGQNFGDRPGRAR